MTDRTLERELKAVRRRGSARRSPLYWYVLRNYPKLSSAGGNGKDGLSWAEVTGILATAGLTTADGEPLATEGVRSVFRRVRRDLAEAEKSKAARPPAKRAPNLPSGRHPPSEVFPVPSNHALPAAPSLPAQSGSLPAIRSQTPPASLLAGVAPRTPEEIAAHIKEQKERVDRALAQIDRKFYIPT